MSDPIGSIVMEDCDSIYDAGTMPVVSNLSCRFQVNISTDITCESIDGDCHTFERVVDTMTMDETISLDRDTYNAAIAGAGDDKFAITRQCCSCNVCLRWRIAGDLSNRTTCFPITTTGGDPPFCLGNLGTKIDAPFTAQRVISYSQTGTGCATPPDGSTTDYSGTGTLFFQIGRCNGSADGTVQFGGYTSLPTPPPFWLYDAPVQADPFSVTPCTLEEMIDEFIAMLSVPPPTPFPTPIYPCDTPVVNSWTYDLTITITGT